MRIVTHRNLQLGGRHYQAGEPQDAPDADATLAIRNGWARPADEAAVVAGAPARRKRKRESTPQ